MSYDQKIMQELVSNSQDNVGKNIIPLKVHIPQLYFFLVLHGQNFRANHLIILYLLCNIYILEVCIGSVNSLIDFYLAVRAKSAVALEVWEGSVKEEWKLLW